MKRVKLFESFINEKGAVLGRRRKSVRVDFNDKRNMRWTFRGKQGDINKGLVILIATEYSQGEPSWWTLATVQDGEIRFQESDLGEIPEWAKKKAIKEAGKYKFKNLKEVSESVEVVNEAEAQFDKAMHKKVLKAIASTKTYMEVEDDSDMREILIATRENGDVYDDTAGQDDIKEAQRVQKILMKKFPGIAVQIETVDEWVHLSIKAPRVANFEYKIEMYDENESNEFKRRMGGDGFDTFEEMVQALEREYLEGVKVDWKSVKKEVDAIDTYPKDKFTGWHQSKGIKIASGVKWGTTTVEIYVTKLTDEIDYKTKKGI